MTRHILITVSPAGHGWHSIPALTHAEACAVARRQHVETYGGAYAEVTVTSPTLTPVSTPTHNDYESDKAVVR